jgi:nitroreductase
MEVFEAIQKRRSVRAYQNRGVEDEKLQKVLEAARLAPSAKNLQNWKFVVIRDQARRNQIAKAANEQMFIADAPIIIVPVATNPDYIMPCEIPAYIVDLAIAVNHMTLQATEEGLGTCWIGTFNQNKIKEILHIPEQYKVVTILPLGYPADKPKQKIRKEMQDIISYELFQ